MKGGSFMKKLFVSMIIFIEILSYCATSVVWATNSNKELNSQSENASQEEETVTTEEEEKERNNFEIETTKEEVIDTAIRKEDINELENQEENSKENVERIVTEDEFVKIIAPGYSSVSAFDKPSIHENIITTLQTGTIVKRLGKSVSNNDGLVWDIIELYNGQQAYLHYTWRTCNFNKNNNKKLCT